ncbi:MAG: glycosyltransferase [Enhydrobacter sp.]|nr:glycosyltransferase [Enhydrobacter sp.]
MSGPERPMRILHVVEAMATGVGRHVLDLSEGGLQAGHAPAVIYSPTREDEVCRSGRARLKDVNFHAVPMRRAPGPWDIAATLQVRKLVKQTGPFDVIHGHSSKGGMLARLAGIGNNSAIVYTPHAISTQDPMLGPAKRLVFGAGERALAWLTDRIIAVSSAECEHIVGLGIPREKLVVIPNGVAPATGPTRREARMALGLAEDELAIGFVGRLSRQKALDVLIAAFAPVAQANAKARLVVIGDGEESAVARQQAEHLGCSRQVIWLGAVDARPRYPAFDLFAQPSRYEGFSYAVLEAASHGVAVLTTDVGGSREAIADGVSGLIVPAGAPDAFAAALVALAADPHRLAAMGRAAREGMGSVDGRQRMIDATLAVYDDLLTSRSEVRK